MAQSFALPFFMAPSDSQHPEIRLREEKSRKRWRKQNKTNIKAVLLGMGKGSQVREEEMMQEEQQQQRERQERKKERGKAISKI